MKIQVVSIAVTCVLIFSACSTDDNNTTGSSTQTTCLTSSFSSDVPAWISDNFTCIQASVSGSNYQIKSNDIPNHNSYYFGSSDSRYEDVPSGNSGNPNSIGEQNYIYTIPATPSLKEGNAGTTSEMGSCGVAANGVSVFNNQAAGNDSLAEELATMDAYYGHPDNQKRYHYHSDPTYLTSTQGKFVVGIMLDGFPIYGAKEKDGSDPTYVTACSHSNALTTENCQPYNNVGNFHCHTGSDNPHSAATIGQCHYHLKLDTDLNAKIINYGAYGGTVGSYTNN